MARQAPIDARPRQYEWHEPTYSQTENWVVWLLWILPALATIVTIVVVLLHFLGGGTTSLDLSTLTP